MATYNGSKYLDDQIESIFMQEGVEVHLFVYDDCSNDSSPQLLDSLQKGYVNRGFSFTLFHGYKNVGFPTSFFKCLAFVPSGFDYYAFSDQDDVWERDKLKSASSALDGDVTSAKQFGTLYKSGCRLYAEPTTSVDENLHFLFERRVNTINFSLSSVFVRARIAAHTMVFDENLRRELLSFRNSHYGFSHGYLALITCLCNSGVFLVGSKSHTLHRRLAGSVSAGGKGIVARIMNELNEMFQPNVSRSDLALLLGKRYKSKLSQRDSIYLDQLSCYKTNMRYKIRLLRFRNFNSDIKFANIEAWISCLFNKF